MVVGYQHFRNPPFTHNNCPKKVRNDLQSFSGRENFSIGYRFNRITEAWRRQRGVFFLEVNGIE